MIAKEKASESMNYLVLVNRLNPLPEHWEDGLETVRVSNSVGDEVEVERKTYAAYLLLRYDLEENDGIRLELDSGRRSVAVQQEIMDRFTEKYGADYAAKTVAVPGYSEHHTGLALDLYYRLDGKDIYTNEEMARYPGIWEKIHAKLAAYGFILRYPDNKEHITGYGYEPWHVRYIDSAEIAGKIMSRPGMTLEVYLGAVNDADPVIGCGPSALYSEEELKEAAVQIKCKFASFPGCELHALRYAGDPCCGAESLQRINSLDPGRGFIQAAKFLSDFTGGEGTEAGRAYADYPWWLGRTANGGWQLISWGQ